MKFSRIAAVALLSVASLASVSVQAQNKTQSNQLVAWLETRSEDELKDTYLRCAAVSTYERMLSPDESTLCVLSSDVLQKRSFNGDLNTQIAWWKAQPMPKETSLAQDLKRAQNAVSKSSSPKI